MSKITLQIGFYLENEHYVQMQAFLPRTQAVKIPQLKVQERTTHSKSSTAQQQKTKKGKFGKSQLSKSQKSQSKKAQSEQQHNEQQQQENPNQMEQQQLQEDQELIIQQDDGIVPEKVDSQKQEEILMMEYLEEEDDSEDDEDDLEDDLSSISRSMSVIRNNVKTKRQKGDRVGLMELPDRRPRKDKKTDEATQVIRREQKQRKRKQYLKKQVEAQEKATLDKILNETGRKLKLKEQKQIDDQKKRDQRQLKSLGDVGKIITIESQQGRIIMLHKTSLFSKEMTKLPEVKIKPECSKCGSQEGRYKIKNTSKVACSLNCYKLLAA